MYSHVIMHVGYKRYKIYEHKEKKVNTRMKGNEAPKFKAGMKEGKLFRIVSEYLLLICSHGIYCVFYIIIIA